MTVSVSIVVATPITARFEITTIRGCSTVLDLILPVKIIFAARGGRHGIILTTHIIIYFFTGSTPQSRRRFQTLRCRAAAAVVAVVVIIALSTPHCCVVGGAFVLFLFLQPSVVGSFSSA
jgi:hypothetical protein